MEKIIAELGKVWTIVGRQDDHNGGFRNRYAGVNDHGGACVLTMGERRVYRCRAYFMSYEEARDFYEKFVEKFGHRENTKFAIKKVSGNNPVIGSEIVLDQSDCGYYYHALQFSDFEDNDDRSMHGIRPTKNGAVSWERDADKREALEDNIRTDLETIANMLKLDDKEIENIIRNGNIVIEFDSDGNINSYTVE